MPIDILLLLLAWAATVSLIVVLPWAVIRVTVAILEADMSMPGADHAQPHQPPDAPTDAVLSHESDGPVEPDDAVPPPPSPDTDVDRADK